MSRPTTTVCDTDNYVTAGACFKAMTSHQRQALMVYLKVAELAALGGTNYLAEMGNSGSLATAARNVRGKLNPFQREIARLVIQQDASNSAGAATSTDINALETAISCLKDFDRNTLDAMDVLLTCQLGRHAAYPQTDL
jgi:hypothetical protein